MNAITRVGTALRDLGRRAATFFMEKQYGSGGWMFSGSGIPISWPWSWWQGDYHHTRRVNFDEFGPIYACVSIISQDLSRIPLKHVRIEDRKEELVTGKAPMRLFRKPNRYQTRSDFILYLGRSLLMDGNFYGLATRNDRGEVVAIYPINPRMVATYIEPDSQEIFYRISRDPTSELSGRFEEEFFLPRDILHIRLHTPKHPLVGESPLVAAVYPTMAGTEINRHTGNFFRNMTRPSGILRHPETLDETAMKRIKDRWVQLFNGPSTGEPAILSEGMEWQQIQMTAVDAELAKSYQLTERQIFQIYRVPPFLGGDLEKATLTNVESLTRFYLQSCLGFYVDHIEEALTAFFGLPSNEYIRFDLEPALLRGDLKERMEALGKGVQNGIYAPNEARLRENLPPVEHGDEPRVQQQLVPLSFGVNMQPPSSGVPSADDQSSESGDDSDAVNDKERRETYDILKRLIAA